MIMRFSFFVSATLLVVSPGFASSAFAMDGVNLDSGDGFTVDDATNFKVGETIALYNADGDEVDLQVQAVKDGGDVWDVDFVDPDSGDAASIEFTKVAN